MKNILLLIALVSGLSSCSIVNKVFHRQVNKSDSLTIIHESKDSSIVKDITQVHTDSSKEDNEIVIDWGSVVDTTTAVKTDSGYFYINTKTGVIKASKVPVKVTIKGTKNAFNFDSSADHSKIELTEKKDNTTQVKSVQKETVKEKEKKSVPVLQLVMLGLLILLIIWVVKNRRKIQTFIYAFFTGL